MWPDGSGYDASEVNDLLLRIAAELDAGRPVGPLIANAAFRWSSRGWPSSRGGVYRIDDIDWFMEHLRLRDDPAEMNADPWRDLAADPYCIRREPGDIAGRIAAPSRQEYADAWRDFGQQPGTRLSLVPTGAWRRELRTAEQQTVATARYGLGKTVNAGGPTFTLKGGRPLTLKQVSRSSLPGIEWPRVPAHMLERPTSKSKTDPQCQRVIDETGALILYTSGKHIDRFPGALVKFPGQRWLRFPVRGTSPANAIMTAVDQAGNKVARYRPTGKLKLLNVPVPIEITVHPISS
jgi:hypothetical protein